MAKKKAKKSSARSHAGKTAKKRKATNPHPFAGKRHKAKRNPFSFFGSAARPKTIGKAVIGVLAGVSIGRAATNMLPATFTGSTLTHTLSAAGVALAEWYLLSMVDPEFGAAAGLGGLAYAGNIALNAVLPEAASYTGIAGMRRGAGDLVRAQMSAYPLLPGRSGIGGLSAYPSAYRRAAA